MQFNLMDHASEGSWNRLTKPGQEEWPEDDVASMKELSMSGILSGSGLQPTSLTKARFVLRQD